MIPPQISDRRDRRRAQRFPVSADATVYFQREGGQPLKAKLSDLSYPFRGLKLASPSALSPQSALRVKLCTALGEPIVTCEGVVAWCREATPGETPETAGYQIGVFVEAENMGEQQALDRQIARLIPVVSNPYTRLKNQETYVQSRFSQCGVAYTDDIAAAVSPLLDLNRRFTLLLEMIAKINSSLTSEELLTRIMEAARELMNSEASSLLLLDQATRELIIQISTGPVKDQITGKRIPRGRGIAGWVVEHEEPVAVEEVASDARHYKEVDQTSGYQTRSLICVPMRGPTGEILGVLEAINRRDNAPYTQEDIDLFTVLADQAAIAIERNRLYNEEKEAAALVQQLILAHHIQERFLPHQPPAISGASLAGMSVPAQHVGGDYYNFLPRDDGSMGLVVGDVCGKGPPAALLMASLQAALRAYAEYHHSVSEVVSRVNRAIWEESPQNLFLTVFYAVFDPQTKTVTYTNAGHNPPLLYRPHDDEYQFLQVGGTLVGVWENSTFEEGRETLQPGDTLVIYTDGVTEAMNPADDLFGEERLIEVIRESHHLDADELVQHLYQTVCNFAQKPEASDDITLLVLKAE